VEALYDFGVPVISPGVVLLLPILYTASYASVRATALTGVLAIGYLLRHYNLNRSEYVSEGLGISADDVSRILIFAVASLGLVTIAHYREEQRRAQTSLQAAYQSAVETDRAKSQFLAVVSHELRTPLTTIIQYTDLLSAGIGGAVTADQREMLQRIEHGALHLRAMIQHLLDYAQLERGGAAIQMESVNVVQLVRHAVALLEPHASARGVELRLELPPAEMLLDTDPSKLRQIVLNLTENAIKFTEQGSVAVRVEAEPGACILTVADTGIGIPADARLRVFEPFWQGEDALTRQRGGLGLGLAIVRELVIALGGEVALQSTVGQGSVFTVRLPHAAAGSAPPPDTHASAG
jgi:signal transduction histidine kinase